MSSSPLPFDGFSQEGLYLAAVLMCAADNKDVPSMILAVQAYAPVGIVEIAEAPPYPQAYIITTPFDVVAVIAGTQTRTEWVYQVLGSPQGPNPGVPGQVDVWFYQAAMTLTNQMGATIVGAAPGRTVTYIGHSLGGAIAQIQYQLLLRQISSPTQVYTFGCPRVGDATFAAAFGIRKLFRVENLNDPIPSLPPQLWAAVGSNYPIPGLPPVAFYTNGGDGRQLDFQGYLSNGSTPSATQAIVNALQGTQPYLSHSSAEYVRRLGLQNFVTSSAGADFEVEAAAIQTTIEPQDWRNEPMSNAPAVALQKVEVFYSLTGDGFSEVFYSTVDQVTLINSIIPNYVQARLLLATQGVQALYGRVSLVGSPRVINFWVPGYAFNQGTLGKIKGSGSGSASSLVPQAYKGTYNGLDVQPQQALLVRMQNAAGYWSRLFLHGFPPEVITGGVYTPTPNFNLVFNSFVTFLKNGSNGWLNQSTTPNKLGNRVSIVSITANPARGSTVMYTLPNPTPPGWPPAVGNSVTIGGAGALEVGMNGRKTVISIVANPPAGQGGFVVGGVSPVGAGPQAGSAYFYLNQLVTNTLQNAIVERLTTHKVGKPVFEPVGRRRNTIPLRR